MVAACANCGKFGEMKLGSSFVCGVCGFYHDPETVNERISAAKRAAKEKEAEDFAARRAAERAAALRKERESVDSLPKPFPRVPETRRSPGPAGKRGGGVLDGSSSCLGGCLSAVIKLLFGIFLAGVAIGAYFSYKSMRREKESVAPTRTSAPQPACPVAVPASSKPIKPAPPVRVTGMNTGGISPAPVAVKPVYGAQGDVEPPTHGSVWRPGMRHPKQSKVYATATPGQWALEPGYEFVNPGTSDWRVRKIPVYVPCPSCNGVGVVYVNHRNRIVRRSCGRCRGKRVIRK